MYTSITNRGKSLKDKMIENYYILNQIVQSIDTGILIIMDRQLLHVNNETRRISQRTYREIEQSLMSFVAPRCRMEAARSYFKVLRELSDRLDVFLDILLPGGSQRTLRCRFSRIKISEADGVFVALHDISGAAVSRRASAPLSLLCHRYLSDFHSVFAKPYDFYLLLDEFYIISNIGLKFDSVTGYSRQDFVGKRIDSLPGLSPYAGLVLALQNCKEAPQGKVPRSIRIQFRTAGGGLASFDIVITMVNFKGVRQRICILFRLLSITRPASHGTPAPAMGQDSKKYNFAGKTVIVAEDSEINCLLLRKILEPTGISILWARNGVECVEIFRQNPMASLVLMDMQMPVMDGFEAAERILAIDSTVPVIAQTAFGFDDDRKRIMEIGCADFVSKPIDRALLLSSIDAVIR